MTITKLATILLWLLPSATLIAAPWEFDEPIDVSSFTGGDGNYFHHLDSSGRRNIAVSGQRLAIAWEDDRNGTPRIYLGHKLTTEASFSQDIRISGAGEAYEPSLAALGGGRFAVAWEEDGHIHLRLVAIEEGPILGPVKRIDGGPSTQVSLTADGEKIFAVWSQRSGNYGRIQAARLSVDDKMRLEPVIDCPVDATPPTDEQLYPTAELINDRLLVVWEDRRPKHTIIMAAIEKKGHACRFSDPLRISEKPEGRNLPYGSGHGVSRAAVGQFGDQGVFAVWADKRNFRDGYDIWGARFILSENRFGGNEKVQDDFGGLAKQRHATVAGQRDGNLVVAWDDEREGDTDVVMSWYDAGEWSEDWVLPVASGEGQQSSPSILLDRRGNLHISWVERTQIGGTTQLKYAFGRNLKAK
ncbi:MAG: hypothetical protein B6D72_19735 [gamma proteobacterium symbiont of Ctena orbiculata]|nr:MAG: hypothetical protein B6D72_19735 [gamma proteobacterium symbiont of Ctena orbiculata]PVV19369.1 MAG: hypothetical protein B6D74_14795 [gamma proteobacterium symbiont of Ctena orbiculata]